MPVSIEQKDIPVTFLSGEEASVATAIARLDEPVSEQTLFVVSGLCTSRDMPPDIAEDFAQRTGQNTVAIRMEYGAPTNPIRQVPARGALVLAKVIQNYDKEKPGALVTQSAAGIAAPDLVADGEVAAYVAYSSVGLDVRSRVGLAPEEQEEIDALPLPDRAEYYYEHGGERRTMSLAWRFFKNSIRETVAMTLLGEHKQVGQAREGARLDIVHNLGRSDRRRWGIRQSRISEALRLAASADITPELAHGKKHHGVRTGAVFGEEGRDIFSPDDVEASTQGVPFDLFVALKKFGHPSITSSRAAAGNEAVAQQVKLLNNLDPHA